MKSIVTASLWTAKPFKAVQELIHAAYASHASHAAYFAAIFAAMAGALLCGKREPLVYASSQQALYEGSLYYNEAGCSGCHGVAFDGRGPEAASLKEERGLKTPDLTKAPAEKRPLDYFKAITAGTRKMPDHLYRTYTDRGRWAMAHFLYSRAPSPPQKEMGKRKAALQQGEQQARTAYAQNSRLWGLGYPPLERRPQSPSLTSLMKADLSEKEGIAAGESSGERLGERLGERSRRAAEAIEGARAEPLQREQREYLSHPAASLYLQNCAGCHGRYGEGMAQAVRIGLIDCDKGDKEDLRQCSAYLSTEDLALFSGSSSDFRRTHREGEGSSLPSFAALGSEEWEGLYDYVRILITEPPPEP